MADKYPGVSPYVYCANNPVRLVDPNGREIGDYYNWQGKRLGWDGQKDDNVYIVSGRIPKKFFYKKTGIVNIFNNILLLFYLLKQDYLYFL